MDHRPRQRAAARAGRGQRGRADRDLSEDRPITPRADDRTLIAAAQAGDRAALDALLRRHVDRIHAVCRRIAGNDADADDATQEALLAVVRGLARYDGRAAFGTWAYRVATNACLDELRRRSRRPDPRSPDELPVVGAQVGDRAVEQTADRLTLDDALAALPPEYREPVVLRDVLEFDYAEIGKVLDIPPGTVRSRIARGRAALARSLSQPDDAAGSAGNQDRDAERTTGAP